MGLEGRSGGGGTYFSPNDRRNCSSSAVRTSKPGLYSYGRLFGMQRPSNLLQITGNTNSRAVPCFVSCTCERNPSSLVMVEENPFCFCCFVRLSGVHEAPQNAPALRLFPTTAIPNSFTAISPTAARRTDFNAFCAPDPSIKEVVTNEKRRARFRWYLLYVVFSFSPGVSPSSSLMSPPRRLPLALVSRAPSVERTPRVVAPPERCGPVPGPDACVGSS